MANVALYNLDDCDSASDDAIPEEVSTEEDDDEESDAQEFYDIELEWVNSERGSKTKVRLARLL